MKKITFLIICLLCCLASVVAQQIEPAGQAGGMLESKNRSVDYATGILHYQVPVAELQTPGYTLPVTLDYTANGVRVGDAPGLIGLGWSLNTGGVVTRVVRGMPDTYRLDVFHFDTDPEKDHTYDNYWLSRRIADGKFDIFTVILNTEKVDFIWQKVNGIPSVVPLEQTNVKIECVSEDGKEFSAWQVTDAQGWQYYFGAREVCNNYQKESDTPSTAIDYESYISAWYMNYLVIPGQDTIYFDYIKGSDFLEIADAEFKGFTTIVKQAVNYHYGEPLNDYQFDLGRYWYDYQRCIEQAQQCIDHDYRLSSWIYDNDCVFEAYRNTITENDLFAGTKGNSQERLNIKNRVNGVLTDLGQVNFVSQELLGTVDMMRSAVGSNTCALMALGHAKDFIKKALREPRTIQEKDIWQHCCYHLKSPVLSGIRWGKRSVNLIYTLSNANALHLSGVMSFENGRLRKDVSLVRNSGNTLLKELRTKGTDGKEYANMHFDYYHENTVGINQDYWGYSAGQGRNDISAFRLPVSPDYVKKNALRQITTGTGGSLQIDYEPNMTESSRWPGSGLLDYYGGLRLKQLVMSDEHGGTDSIFYHYPLPGQMMYDTLVFNSIVEYVNGNYVQNTQEGSSIISYKGLQDRINHPRVSCEGNVYVNTGNNGLFYPYVQEIFPGKGMNAYLYSVAPASGKNAGNTYPWWLNGVLLGKASYDESNRLVEVNQYHYYSSRSMVAAFPDQEFFEEKAGMPAYEQNFGEVKLYEFYSQVFDENIPESQKIEVFRDEGEVFYIDPYANLYRRSKTKVPAFFRPWYDLYYGGKTLLKEQRQYRYADADAGEPSPAHIRRPEQIGGWRLAGQEEYAYDQAAVNTSPTRIIHRESNGDESVVTRFTVSEFTDQAFPLAASMKAGNLFAPVLKEQKWLRKSGENFYRLLNERVHEYAEVVQADGRVSYLPQKELHLLEASGLTTTTLPVGLQSSLYTYSSDRYYPETQVTYGNFGRNCLPQEFRERGKQRSVFYTPINGSPVLEMMGTNQQAIVVSGEMSPNVRAYCDVCYLWPQIEEHILTSPAFDSYQNSAAFRQLKSFVSDIKNLMPPMILNKQKDMIASYRTFVNAFSVWYNSPHAREEGKAIYQKFCKGIQYFLSADFLQLEELMYIMRMQQSNLIASADRKEYHYQNVELKIPAENTGCRLYLYMHPETDRLKLDCSTVLGDQVSVNRPEIQLTVGKDQLVMLDIGFSEQPITLAIPAEVNLITGFAVPFNSVFHARGYDSEGRLVCSFDQTGRIEHYEYDPAGRVCRILDKDDNILKENLYGLPAQEMPAFVRQRVYLQPTAGKADSVYTEEIAYLDGQNREIQRVAVNSSPDGGDIILPKRYGKYGREEQSYLPYVRNGNNGQYDTDAFAAPNWSVYGSTDQAFAYSRTDYDNSPLDRITGRIGPGAAWLQGHKGTGISYGTNSAQQVICWRLDADGLPVKSGYYAAGQLEYKQTTGEDGQRTEVFSDVVDGEERILLTIDYNGNVAHATYQVYDERGRLCWVLPPEATDRIAKAGMSAEILHQYAYHYRYDAWGHLSMKRLPGCEPEYFIYDACDRLVMSQDGKQREQSAGRWAYNRYDDLERLTEIGEIELTTVQTPAQLQAVAGVNTEYVPQGTLTPLQVMRYDDYVPTTLIPAGNFVSMAGYDAQPCSLSRGLLTGQAQRVLGTDQWLATTFWYDERGREIQRESNNLLGGSSRVCSGYDFTDRLVRLRESHSREGGAEDVAEMVNTYDPRGRILTSQMVLNGQGTAEISYRYDALGRMTGKTYGTGAHALTETMAYNVRSWLTEKNSGQFRMKLRYEAPEKAAACYNGNISEWEWQQGTGPVNLYSFTYDGLNRLTDATGYTRNATDWMISNDHTEKGLSYDLNGNLLALQRTTGGPASSYAYQYSGNQLTALTKDGTSGNYSYDANGNMVTDSRRGLVLSYNCLNLLDEVSSGGQLAAHYSYLADGSKLRVRDVQGHGYDYLGSLIYRNDNGGLTLESMLFSDGQICRTVSAYETHYFLRDHLGSVRQVVNASTGLPIESNDYYPFGGRHVSAGTFTVDNRYRYNGKEVQTTGNLGYLDYGARMYDAELGRWFGMDLQSETYYAYSPYAYCMNNPLVYTDPNGMEVIRDDKGNFSITGDDIYRFWGNILSVAEGKTPFDNFMDALNMAADSEDRRFLNLGETTDITGSNSLRFLRGEKQDFSGFWGNVKYFASGGHLGGVHYNHDGYAIGMSPLMGIAPSPGMKGGGKYLKGLGRVGEDFHKATKGGKSIKKMILDIIGKKNFEKIVGYNPDIRAGKDGLIFLRGNGQYLGKVYKTDLLYSDFFD